LALSIPALTLTSVALPVLYAPTGSVLGVIDNTPAPVPVLVQQDNPPTVLVRALTVRVGGSEFFEGSGHSLEGEVKVTG